MLQHKQNESQGINIINKSVSGFFDILIGCLHIAGLDINGSPLATGLSRNSVSASGFQFP